MKLITVNTKNIIKKSEQGFTLIELLVVIGILAILMGIVLIAINPAAQFAQANNTDRTNAVGQILNAIGQYEADHKGLQPAVIPTSASTPAVIADAKEIANGAGAPAGSVDLCTPLVTTSQYIPSFPEDPKTGTPVGASITDCTTYDSGYMVVQDSGGRVTIFAPGAEQVRGVTPKIQVTR